MGQGHLENPFNFVSQEVCDFPTGSLAQCWYKVRGGCILNDEDRSENITHSTHPVLHSQPCAVSQIQDIHSISKLCPFIFLVNFQGPAFVLSPSQKSFSFSLTQNQYCLLLGHLRPFYFMYDIAITCFASSSTYL